MGEKKREIVKKAKRVVVKVGSAVIAGGDFDRIAGDLAALISEGREVVLVSSGSIAMGMEKLGLKERPSAIPERQAIAALGQTALMARYEEAFAKFDRKVAQILLTHDDFADRKRFRNAQNTVSELLDMGVVPVINENDTVAVDELKFGDNDNLSALTTSLCGADVQIILTDIDSVYDKNPRKHDDAGRISFIEDIDSFELHPSSIDTGAYGTGGMVTKVSSAATAAHHGCATVIASGMEDGVMARVFAGEDVGTFVPAKEDRLTRKKHWIAYSTRPTGRVFVDDGARGALVGKGKSLLPSGIVKIDGTFEAGEVVHCVDSGGMEFARGVVNYNSGEIDRIKGLKSGEIEAALGYRVYDEVIHRDNLVVM
ncbi:MAG: glutamate 5-kinase [Thermodesulfobacteriota bacterium]